MSGYAFTWGNKQEATAIWYGMVLADGSLLGAADAMTETWTGAPPAERVPEIRALKVDIEGKVAPGTLLNATLEASDPNGDALQVKWVLQHDPMMHGTTGTAQPKPPVFPEAITLASNRSAQVKMPVYGGAYRLFAYVYDGKGGAAVANVPLWVEGGTPLPEPAAKPPEK